MQPLKTESPYWSCAWRQLDDVSFVDRSFFRYVGLVDPLVVQDRGFYLGALLRWNRLTDQGDHSSP